MNFVSRSLPAIRRLGWLAAMLFSIFATSAGGNEIFTSRHVAKLKTVVAAEISPDGKHIAYTLLTPRIPLEGDNGPSWTQLHVVDRKGSSRAFVGGEVNVGGVQWTPDSKAIVFTAKRGEDKNTSLYRIFRDGGEAKKVLEHDADLRGAVISRDGKQVAFLATPPLAKEQQEYQDKGFNQEIYEEDWRPTKVWIAPLDGSNKPRSLDLPGSVFDVRWSPSGKQLAVVLAPTPLVDDSYMFKRVRIVDAETGKVMEKIANPGKLGQIGWSPDGKHVAMISGVDIHDPAEGRLMVAAIPGDGKLRDLTPDLEGHVESFAWQNADSLLCTVARGTKTTLETVPLSGESKPVIEHSQAIARSLSLAADGQTAAIVAETPKRPAEVFLLAPQASSLARLTDNNLWLKEMRLARQEVVRWKARDGLELAGILIYPLNYEPGRRYPLIMAVHGGPEAHISDGWLTRYSYPGQVGAGRGFMVFYPNYRGSTGRGVAFSMQGQADAAGKEFDDLVDGVDYLIGRGLVNRDKVGITGGSYGGYASAWGATYYSDRFAASVMFVGISNNISKTGTTDIPEEMFLVHHRKRLWDDWEYFLERSPIRHVQKGRTPTLILHGKSDPRVHPSQSMELYRHLKTLGKAPVRLVFYPGEGHGNRRAAARFDYNVRMLRWFEHYLQGDGGKPPEIGLDYKTLLASPEND